MQIFWENQNFGVNTPRRVISSKSEKNIVLFLMLQIVHLSCYIAAVKKRTTGMSFIFSIEPSHPISAIATSHVYRLKKTRNEGDHDQKLHTFLIKRVRT